jgi:E3 ubiquitin-protein ligase HERC2
MLLGVACRTGAPLDLDLPPLVWRALCGAPAREADWADVDARGCAALAALDAAEDTATEEERDALLPHAWAAPRLDGALLHLAPNGDADAGVRWEDRRAYVAAARAARAAQLSPQLAAMRAGLASVLPGALLPLLPPRELARRACGSPDVNVAALRASATYAGVRYDEPHIAHFWAALESFTPRQRRAFLRFAWGRARLPPPGSAAAARGLELQPLARAQGADPDAYLPVAHTCFFAVELPRYSSAAVMARRLLYACEEGVAIDIDHAVRDARAWGDAGGDDAGGAADA